MKDLEPPRYNPLAPSINYCYAGCCMTPAVIMTQQVSKTNGAARPGFMKG